MNRLKEILAKIDEAIKSLLSRIEESSISEKLMMYYEGLDPTRQALVRGSLRLVCLVGALLIAFMPVWKSYSTKSAIRMFNGATFQLQVLAAKGAEVVAQAQKPSTWQNLPASSAPELDNSLREYLANIGVAEELFTTRPDGQDRLELNIEELTLKQALALTFQFDGWYPNVRAEDVEINVNPQHSDRLSMKVAAYIPAAIAGGGFDDNHDTDFESTDHEVNPNVGAPPHSNGQTGNGGDDFDVDPNQVPPPPVEYNDNPPPPPPTFDENFDDSAPNYEEGGDI